MNENLNQFHKWITENCDNYVSMVLIGSVATGDQWIDGRSDIDILIIFENLENNQKEKIKDYLLKADFNDVYTFVPMTKEYWLNNKNHSHDFSGKFRSKIIFGENIIDQKQIPNKETAFKIYNAGLEDVKKRITRTIINEGIWSENKIRNVFWKLFKHSFMYLAIKHHHDKNIYPKSRKDLVTYSNSSILNNTLETLNNIDNKNKEEIVAVSQELLNYINSM